MVPSNPYDSVILCLQNMARFSDGNVQAPQQPCKEDMAVECIQILTEGNDSSAREKKKKERKKKKRGVQINAGLELTLTSCVTNALPRGVLAGSVWALMPG